MKEVSNVLEIYLNETKSLQSCDLYEIVLKSGVSYCYAGADIQVQHDGKTYRHDGPIFKRTQTKINSTVSVDKLTITIYCDKTDTIGNVPLMAAVHNGGLDGARFVLRRAFFRGTDLVDVIDLFDGFAEVKEGGGMTIKLEAKSVVQKLNSEWPQRRYYPTCPYTLFSDECGVSVTAYRKRVTVTAVPDYNTVQFNTTFANGYYDAGGIEWLSGPLVGQSTQVLRSASNRLMFMTPSEAQPEVGNEAYIYPGCDKTPATCRSKFNNFSRNRATPYVPRKETIR